MRPHWISLLITASWLTMMTLLVRDHMLPRPIAQDAQPVEAAALARRWQDIRECLLVRRGTQVMGANALTVLRDPQTGGHRASERLRLDLGLGVPVTVDGAARLSPDLAIERFWVHLGTAGLGVTAQGEVKGDVLVFELITPMARSVHTQPLGGAGGASLLDALQPAMFENLELRPGASYRIRGADLFGTLGVGDLLVEVRDYDLIETSQGSVPAYQVVSEFGGISTTSWVDETGRLVLQRLWGDLILERTTPQVIERHWPGLLEEVPLPEFTVRAEGAASPWPAALESPFALRRILSGDPDQ